MEGEIGYERERTIKEFFVNGIEQAFIGVYQLTSDKARKEEIEKLIGKEKIERGLRK